MHAPGRASRGARRRRARARRDHLSRPRRRRRGPRQPAIVLPALPRLFAPFYGDDERVTLLKTVVPDQVWALEQNLAIGPLETPLRCVVIRLEDGSLWIHAPLAPTAEFFALVESIGGPVRPSWCPPTRVGAQDLRQGPPSDGPPPTFGSPRASSPFPWRCPRRKCTGGSREGARPRGGRRVRRDPAVVERDRLRGAPRGNSGWAWKDVTIREATFFHARSKTLVVTDAVARGCRTRTPPLQTPEKLLLVGKRSTSGSATSSLPAVNWRGGRR